MKIVDDFLSKVGTDKALHDAFGAKICAIIMIISLIQDGIYTSSAIVGSAAIGTIATIFLIIFKEIFDTKFDWIDVLAGLIGCAFIWLAIGIGFLLNCRITWKTLFMKKSKLWQTKF